MHKKTTFYLKNALKARINTTLSIIIPVFNEEKTIQPLLEKIKSVRLPGIRKEIILVDDGSTDQTPHLLRKLRMSHLRIFHHEQNRGKGAAIRTAIPHAKGDFILIQDADLEYDPADYPNLLKPLLRDEADAVYGSRFMGEHRNFFLWNYCGNKILTFLANLLYHSDLTDVETGYKVFKGHIFRGLNWRANRFTFDPEFTAKLLKSGRKILEVPVSYNGRSYQNGKKLTWLDGFRAMYSLVHFRFSN
jgi:glycosyltransferase involved in cell wall biosynthesis